MKMMKYSWFPQPQKCPNALPASLGDVGNFCQHSMLGFTVSYAIILGVIGCLLRIYDIIQVVKNGCMLNCNLWRTRSRWLRNLCPPHVERDLKLVSLAFSLEYYLMLALGSLINCAILLIPWLIFYMLMILGEFSMYVQMIFSDQPDVASNNNFLKSILLVFNWLSIFCAFLSLNNNKCFW